MEARAAQLLADGHIASAHADAPLEERRARAVQLRRTVGTDLGEIGALDATAIATVADESWPVVRDADELHDALLPLVAAVRPAPGTLSRAATST